MLFACEYCYGAEIILATVFGGVGSYVLAKIVCGWHKLTRRKQHECHCEHCDTCDEHK